MGDAQTQDNPDGGTRSVATRLGQARRTALLLGFAADRALQEDEHHDVPGTEHGGGDPEADDPGPGERAGP